MARRATLGLVADTVVVETERLILRAWSLDDVDELARVFAVDQVWWFPFRRGFDRDETEQFVVRQRTRSETHGFAMWAATLKPGGHIIGYIGLAIPEWLPEVMPSVDVGWRLHPRTWGLGLATEGGRGALEYAFDHLGLDRVIAIYDVDNVASGRVMEKLGMRPFHRTHDPNYDNDLAVYELLRDDWARGR